MGYDAIRSGITGILNAQGLSESLDTDDFKSASSEESGNTFILNAEDGEADDTNEQQSAFLYDNQKWTVKIAFQSSDEAGASQRDAIHRKRDTLLAELDDPANWRTFCTLLRYRSWKVEERPSYFVLTIELKIKDALTY